MPRGNSFSRDVQPFRCEGCGRNTTGKRGSNCILCPKCYHAEGLRNVHSDSGHEQPVRGCPDCPAQPQPQQQQQQDRSWEALHEGVMSAALAQGLDADYAAAYLQRNQERILPRLIGDPAANTTTLADVTMARRLREREIAAQAAAQMRPTWILLPDQRVPAPCLHTLSVLADYNGPQIVVAQGPDGALYLGVASDETPGLVRWLYAPITEAELRSLHAGELSLRAALVKPRTYVVDADREEMPVAAWLGDATTLHESDLPQPAALLPGHAPVVA